MSFPSYPNYRETGIGWMPRLPAHWELKRVRHLLECLDGARIPLNAEERAGREGDIPYWGANSIVGYVDEALFDEELVLLGEDGAPFFDDTKSVAFVVKGKIWPNNHVHVLRPRIAHTGPFMAFALNATDYSRFVEGATRDKLTQAAMNRIPVPWPPPDERRAIVRFLDAGTMKIDSLIGEQQRLIELLNEKRQAFMSQLVTKGLHPNAPMKPSGTPWLGDVPAHWTSVRLKTLFRPQKRQGHVEEPVLSVYRDYGVIYKNSRNDNINKTPEDLSSYQLVEPGDLVVNKMKAWQGSLGVSSLRGITSPDYMVFTPRRPYEHEFVHFLLRSRAMVSLYRGISNGIRPDQWRLEADRFLELQVFLPPNTEQRAIASYVSGRVRDFDALAIEAERAITLLQERRAALVSAAVTGQIDVRHIAARSAA